jgi:uncharacterized protein involved in exopolysaccharide biosynthesis
MGSINKEKIHDFIHDDTINMVEIVRQLWYKKITIIIITSIFAVISILYALSLPNIYRSSILLAPMEENSQSQLAGLAQQFGGLAGGLNIGSGTSLKTPLSLETLRSRKFIKNFVKKHDILIALMAIESWSVSSNEITYDDKIYDITNKNWVLKIKNKIIGSPPLDYMVHEKFIENLKIETDKDTGFVSISFDFYEPNLAQKWLSLLIDDLNEFSRTEEIKSSKISIQYLQEQLQKTNVLEIKNLFYQLIQEKIKDGMLAETTEDFIFKVIDPAIVPEKKNSPKRAIIVTLFTFIGGLLSFFYVLLIPNIRKITNKNN